MVWIAPAMVDRGRIDYPMRRHCVMPVNPMGGKMTTSKKDASKASKLLKSKTASKAVKSVAGSDLAQARRKPKAAKKGR